MSKQLRSDVLKLIEDKEKLENEIRELSNVLTKNHVGMNDPLVDDEGFPLSHIDIYQVRHARHLLIHKQNDHKDLMRQIEEGIGQYYSDPNLRPTPQVQEIPEHTEPFARIAMVHPGSPADSAGIHDGDFLVEFGSINAKNYRGLDDIGAVVQHSDGHRISVKIKRGESYARASLTPRKWNGRGLLGCNVHPIS